MKKVLGLFAALALALPGAAMAKDNGHKEHPENHGKHVSQAAHYKKGDHFDRDRAPDYRVVNYRDYRGLNRPPEGYHYVRSGSDVLLVGITSGIVSAVFGNLIN